MKASVNKERCIGCGACVASVPEVFDFDDDGLTKTIVDNIPEEKVEETKNAADMCPGSAITIDE